MIRLNEAAAFQAQVAPKSCVAEFTPTPTFVLVVCGGKKDIVGIMSFKKSKIVSKVGVGVNSR